MNAAGTDAVQRVADLLWASAQGTAALACLPPHDAPDTAERAYAIQSAFAAMTGTQPMGWKVGVASGVLMSLAPILRGVHASPARLKMPLRPCVVESEVGLLIGQDIPVRRAAYTREDLAGAVAGACAAIELAAPRAADFFDAPMPHKIADCMGSDMVVAGPPAGDWQALALHEPRVRISFDGVEQFGFSGPHPGGDPLDALVALANAPMRWAPLRAGQIVITGTCTGIRAVRGGTTVRVDVQGLGPAVVQLEEREPD